jgi:diphthine synthase
LVESESDQILRHSKNGNVSFLVVGDALAATTHTDLMLRAKQQQIKVQVIHNASIMNAVACCGLQLYHFGPSVSIPFFTEKWRPQSFYDKISVNRKNGFHTLCLLGIFCIFAFKFFFPMSKNP